MKRLERIVSYMQEQNLDAVLLLSPQNVSWLSGFTGESAAVMVFEEEQVFLTDFRYLERAEKETTGFSVQKCAPKERLSYMKRLMASHGTRRLGIEKNYVTVRMMEQFRAEWDVEFIGIDEAVMQLRSRKTEEELRRMREGAKITEAVFAHVLDYVRPHVTEYDLLAEMVYFMHRNHVSPSFPPIIASGENAAMPHASVTGRMLTGGDFLTLDFGCKYQGVCTDFTRTIGISGVEQTEKMIYNTVKKAQDAVFEVLRPGILAREADAAAREVIAAAGYGQYFEHGTGHGVGVEIHEAPTLNAHSDQVLEEGMVVTVEPGIYLPGRTGVRIEDMVVLTKDGFQNFYTEPRELIVI